jgi:hypothetical protein
MNRYLHCAKSIREFKLYGETSDEFFARGIGDFDLIFIDGLHRFDQVRTDLENSLTRLSPRGVIVLHDTLPPDGRYVTQRPSLHSRGGNELWCGDVWRILVWLWGRTEAFATVRDDYGCTAVWPASRPTRQVPDSWEWFDSNRDEVARVVPLDELLEELCVRRPLQ